MTAWIAPRPAPISRWAGSSTTSASSRKVFAATAAKDVGERTASPPEPSGSNLEAGWRARMTTDLQALADAWDAPDAWDGMTQAGGHDLPGAIAGRIALDELIVHGWDIAQALGEPFECDDESLSVVADAVRGFRDGNDGEMPGLWGPVVPVPDDAPLLDQVLGLTGRDPSWTPPT